MSCTSSTQNIVLSVAETALLTFEGILPALSAAGKVNPTTATAIQNYIDTASTTLNGVVADLKSNTSTLSKVSATLQTLVQESNQFASLEPPNVMLAINLSNTMVQAVIAAIQANQASATIPAPTSAATTHSVLAHAAPEETIHSSTIQKFKLDDMQKRIAKVQQGVHQFLGTAPASTAANPFN